MIGSSLACGLTHTAIVRLEVVKCRSKFFKMEMDLRKYGFYEIFKDVYKGIVREENAKKYQKICSSNASGSAEVIIYAQWKLLKLECKPHNHNQEHSLIDQQRNQGFQLSQIK